MWLSDRGSPRRFSEPPRSWVPDLVYGGVRVGSRFLTLRRGSGTSLSTVDRELTGPHDVRLQGRQDPVSFPLPYRFKTGVRPVRLRPGGVLYASCLPVPHLRHPTPVGNKSRLLRVNICQDGSLESNRHS